AGKLLVAGCLCLEPRARGRRVVQLQLAATGQQALGGEPDPGGRAVELGLTAVPLRRLVAAPRGRDRDEREDDAFDDLERPFAEESMRRVSVSMLVQVLRDLDVRSLGHGSRRPYSGLSGPARP